MTDDEYAKAEERRARHLKQLREALPQGMNAPPPPSPFGPMSRPQRQPGVPEFFMRGLGEAARHTGNAVGGALNGINDWHINRGREVIALDDERKRIEAEYLPQIRAANSDAKRARNLVLGLWAPEKEFLQRAERGNRYIGERMDRAMYDPQPGAFSGSTPPEELSDDDLLAELAALNGQGGPR